MTPDLYWIPGPWTGRLAVVSRPRGWDWLEDEASGWHTAGLDVIVSLLEEEEAAQLGLAYEGAAASAIGIRYLSFPIPDRDVPSSMSAALLLVKEILTELESGRNVAVHCRQSIGRSGLIAASLLATSGIELEHAIQAVSTARGLTIPETPEQLRWLRRLPIKNMVTTS